MKGAFRHRNSYGTRGFRALGLFVAVWLNLALAPCAMAYEAAQDHDCPHCPPEEMQGHHDMHAGMQDEMPCADELADCLIEDEVNHDGRAGQLKVGDAPVAFVFDSLDDSLPTAPADGATAPPRYASIHPGAPPPTHLLNCVFLD